MSATTADVAVHAARPNRFMITVALMSATLIQVLDTTIVNVALPHMQGELGATSDQISWVLTSYLVASAICMPLTGYFADVLGRKRFVLICIAGFIAASALCGISANVTQIVVFRVVQGIFGAALVPLSQAIMADAYPPEERGRAMAIWGLGVMVGPVAGPTLGGWLTEIASWRWTFYINVPIGALSFLLALQFIPESPLRGRRMDWTGFGLIALGIAALQYLLDRGNHADWFESDDIVVAAFCAVLGLTLFVLYSWKRGEQAIFDVRTFLDRNFGITCLIMGSMGLGMFGGMVLQPIFLESLLGYPILTTGLVMAPRGIATALTMWLVGRLVAFVDARVLVTLGIAFSAVASYAMTFYSLETSTFNVIWPGFLLGVGSGLIFVPLSTVAYATLDRSRMVEAAGMYSLVRTIGSSIGISVITTVMAHQGQIIWNELGAHVTLYHDAVGGYLSRLGLHPTDPRGLAIIAQQIAQQSQMGAMLDAFKLITWSCVLMFPLVLLLRRSTERTVSTGAATEH